MQNHTIQIEVGLDNTQTPESITWNASGSTADKAQVAKGMLLSLWDGQDKAALRIDLWTKQMMVDEMADFFHQTMLGMADTFERATKMKELSGNMRTFANAFHKKFVEEQEKENKKD
jgi:gliding motility-associated protein GldC